MLKTTLFSALMALPFGAAAQQPPTTPPPTSQTPGTSPGTSEVPPSSDTAKIQTMFVEFQQIQQQLDDVRQQALEKPELAQTASNLQQQLEQKMIQADPQNKQRIARFNDLDKQFRDLTAAGNPDEASKLMPELQQLADTLLEAQKNALESADMVSQLETFEGQVEAEMQRIEPDTAQLLKRADELEVELRAALAAHPEGGN